MFRRTDQKRLKKGFKGNRQIQARDQTRNVVKITTITTEETIFLQQQQQQQKECQVEAASLHREEIPQLEDMYT